MLKKTETTLKSLILGAAITSASMGVQADFLDDLMKDAKGYGNLRLRYEDAEVGDNSDSALTLRTLVGLKTGTVNGFSAVVEFEDVRQVLGMDEDADGFNIIADTEDENTELEQAFVQYKNDMVTAKLGRQIITLDGHRHVGHVGWRQDFQTFDAGRVIVTPVKGLKLDYTHIYRVNRINSPGFADVGDTSIDLLNASFVTPVGKLVGYYYGLSEDGLYDETDTTGISFSGKAKVSDDLSVLYAAEYATQENETSGVEPDYQMLELGVSVAGITAKIGQEVLGSDTADGTTENFVTPIATVHKFQGWADVFLGGSLFGTIDGGNGVEDTYFSIGTKVAGVNLLAVHHTYDSEGGSNDLGDELNLLATKKFGKRYTAGLKYADYSEGDIGADATRYWAWIQAKL